MIECSEQMVVFLANAFQKLNTSELETLWSILKKLYAFDEKQQDGFEEVGISLTDNKEVERTLLEKFSNIRNKK